MDTMRDRLYPLSLNGHDEGQAVPAFRKSFVVGSLRGVRDRLCSARRGESCAQPRDRMAHSQWFSNPEYFGRRSWEPVPCCRVG